MAATSYTIDVPQASIDELKQRLSYARFPDELDDSGWDLGAPLADVKNLVTYWRDSFDWRKAEAELNELPNFQTIIKCNGFDPLKIHFLHKKSSNANAIPLCFVHGWPGSFIEAAKVTNELASPSNPSKGTPSFHVVAPSLPNFGFSEGPKQRGFALSQYAETCHKLMQQLGYTQYVIQGGDWGYYITRAMSLLYPQHCKATHVNMDQGVAPSFSRHPILALEHTLKPYTAHEQQGLKRTEWFLAEGSGYRAQQATKPQTLGYGLASSPEALLAWIYEKLHDWTDAYPWTPDEVCTWVSIYWFSTAGPAASLRIYYEATHDARGTPVSQLTVHSDPSSTTDVDPNTPVAMISRERTRQYIGGGVKLGLLHSPMDVRVLPSVWTRTQGEVVFERTHESGGHFFAWEKPDQLLGDVRGMFGRNGGAFGVVEGRDGC